MAISSAWQSPNKAKHERTDRISRWHLDAVMGTLHQLIEGTGANSILDAGCGEGFITAFLAHRNPKLKITGVDVVGEAIKEARLRCPSAQFREGNLLKLPFSDKSFDLVLCCQSLEHVENYARALLEMKRVTRRYVVISVPREPYFRIANRIFRLVGMCSDPSHLNYWTHHQFKELMQNYFRVLEMRRKHIAYQMVLAELLTGS